MYNRKERRQISKKLGNGRNKTMGGIAKEKVNWRQLNNEKKKAKEEHLLRNLDEMNQERKDVNDGGGQASMANGMANQAKRSSAGGNQKTWYSLSVALPGSILNNIQTRELRAYVTGELARTFAIFCVDEVVIFDEAARMSPAQIDAYYNGDWTGDEPIRENNAECNFHMARILEYLECPQYLRRMIFPIHNSLQFAGLLNPLDAMHHLRSTDTQLPYREGIVLDKPVVRNGQCCDVGLDRNLVLHNSEWIPPYTRVTVKIDKNAGSTKLRGSLTSPTEIREEAGIYWGYSLRIAKSLSEAISTNGYDFVIGTSEKGTPLADLVVPYSDSSGKCKILLVFGGLAGLEAAVEADQDIRESDPADYFPNYINCLPDQGSRIIRTEEAIPIFLAALKYKLG